MRTAPVIGLVLGLAAIAGPPSARAGEMAELPYHELKNASDKIVAMRAAAGTATDKVLAYLAIARKTPSADPIRLWIDRTDGRLEIPISAEGIITLPSSPDLIADDPLVHSNAPKGTLTLGVDLNIVLPDPPFDYATVTSATQQLDRAIRAESPIGFLAPKVKSLQLFMAPGEADCVVKLVAGGTDANPLLPDKDGMVEIKLSDALESINPTITPTCPLLKHDIQVD